MSAAPLSLNEHIAFWLLTHPLSPAHVDCATAVMLKILDGKCKMKGEERMVMAGLYAQVKTRPGLNLGEDVHLLIAAAGNEADEAMKMYIYETRVLAETVISRPVMKGFKAMLREQGLLAGRHDDESDVP